MNEELLISLVEKYSELYNHEDPRYHDDQRRMNILEEIAGIINETPTACKEKWKKIRENFRKATNLRKTKSGQAAKNFKPIRYSKELTFLTPYIQSESKSLTNLASVSSDNEQSNITSPSSAHGSSAVSVETAASLESVTKKKKIREESPNSTQTLFQSYIDKKYSRDRQEDDPIITFFKNLGQTVKQFPPDLQLRVKRSVFNVVSDAEEEFIQSNTVQLSFPTSCISQTSNEYEVDIDGVQSALPNTSFSQNVNTHPATVVLNSSSQLPSTQSSQTNLHTGLITHDITSAPIFLSTLQKSPPPQTSTYPKQLEKFISFSRK